VKKLALSSVTVQSGRGHPTTWTNRSHQWLPLSRVCNKYSGWSSGRSIPHALWPKKYKKLCR